jgi:hypothetical protein
MTRIVSALLLAATALGTWLAAPAYADGASVDAYLAQVARQVQRPGVYVDPEVYRDGRLTPAQADGIRELAGKQPSQLHVWVIPASRISVDGHLLYRPPALIARLHRLVGAPGTYAVLVEAPTQAAGQSFYAYQWAGSGPIYRTGKAAREAIRCCAPDYDSMLRRFVRESDVRRGTGEVRAGDPFRDPPDVAEDSAGSGGFGGVFVIVLVGAAVLGVATVLFRRGLGAPSPADVNELRRPLADEIEEVRQQISAADTTPAAAPDDPVTARIAAARQALDQAHLRLTTMASPADAQAVTAALADARYELTAATALREGRAVPPRTAPCFVDPRHGPSVTTRLYPASGLTTPVPVCAACDAALAAGTQPLARTFMFGGSRHHAWSPYGPAWWYLMGYWGQQPFLTDLAHHQGFLDGTLDPARHHLPDSGGGGFFGGGGGFGGHQGVGGGGGHHGGFGGMGGMGGGGHHGGGGGFGGGGGGHHG